MTRYRKYWNIIKKKDAKADAETLNKLKFERSFLSKLIHLFFDVLNEIPADGGKVWIIQLFQFRP